MADSAFADQDQVGVVPDAVALPPTGRHAAPGNRFSPLAGYTMEPVLRHVHRLFQALEGKNSTEKGPLTPVRGLCLVQRGHHPGAERGGGRPSVTPFGG